MPKTFEVAFPIIRGYDVYTVEAENEDDAVEMVLNGEVSESSFDDIEVDFDSNLAVVDEITNI